MNQGRQATYRLRMSSSSPGLSYNHHYLSTRHKWTIQSAQEIHVRAHSHQWVKVRRVFEYDTITLLEAGVG